MAKTKRIQIIGVDNTLTKPGVPADAKTVGDRFESLADVPTPEASDSGKYLRVNTAGEWEIQAGESSGGGGSTGSDDINYVEYVSNGAASISVAVTNNTIFSVKGYTSVSIVIPSELDSLSIWECYLYIHFSESDAVSLTLPSGIRRNGDDPVYVEPNDVWEISINKQGGAVCLRT